MFLRLLAERGLGFLEPFFGLVQGGARFFCFGALSHGLALLPHGRDARLAACSQALFLGAAHRFTDGAAQLALALLGCLAPLLELHGSLQQVILAVPEIKAVNKQTTLRHALSCAKASLP